MSFGTIPSAPFPPNLVAPINRLCARWAAALDEGSTTFSAAGVWPLLAILSAAAAPHRRSTLEDATGVPSSEALKMAHDLMEWFATQAESLSRATAYTPSEGITGALGLWVTPDLHLKESFTCGLPYGSGGQLTGSAQADQARLDAWACEMTKGIIPTFPMSIPGGAQMAVLASAITLQTSWYDKFTQEYPTGAKTPALYRTTYGSDIVRCTDNVTVLCVRGQDDIDVHLVLGREGAPAAEVLPLGLAALERPPLDRGTNDATAIWGPGIRAEVKEAMVSGEDTAVHVALPPFRLESRHDLSAHPAVFGLQGMGRAPGSGVDFPHLTDGPLVLDDGSQTATAAFQRNGFSAAAVTALTMFGGRAGPEKRKVLRLGIRFDRPFGFLATHRSGVVLFAGWVADGFDAIEW